MRQSDLRKLLQNPRDTDKRLKYFLKKRLLKRQALSEPEIRGHISKAENNLDFLSTLDKRFNDWILVGCYYALYHSALALLQSIGFSSKNHDAALCVLIRHFYNKGISEEEIRAINSLEADEILFYHTTRMERENASYSSKTLFDDDKTENTKKDTIMFVNKVKELVH